MKKALLICSWLIAFALIVPLSSYKVYPLTQSTALRIPQPVLVAAEQWACDYGILPETPPPDRLWARYAQISKQTFEVHWFWIKNGLAGDVQLLIQRNGTILSETW